MLFDAEERQANHKAYQTHLQIYDTHRQRALAGGSDQRKAQQREKGKWLVRQRIEYLMDANSAFFEIGLFCAQDCYDAPLPAAGLITGIASIANRTCMIIANDPTVKGGTFFPLTVKKHLRAQAIARTHRLPCFYLVDSGGAYLPLQDEVFPDKDHFGRIFYEQAMMSSEGIAQIAIVLGSCTAGGAYIPAMADQSIMVKQQATVFLAGPPLVKAATGEVVSAEQLGGADLHCRKSGVADYLADSEADALDHAKSIAQHLTQNKPIQKKTAQRNEEIYQHIACDPRFPMDAQAIIHQLVDDGQYHEFKQSYGPSLLCGFAHIGGHNVGILANQGVLMPQAALKGAHFIELCAQRDIPLLFLQNITGFMVGQSVEAQGITKHGAKMVMAVANAKVPKLSVFMGSSYGAGNYAMCGSAFDPNFTFIWPNAKLAVMGGEQAAMVLEQIQSDHNVATLKADYEHKSSAYYAASQLWADCLIDPADTRHHLITALDVCQNAPQQKSQFGVFRM